MKIGILTHPLIRNYGGILQAYALFNYLKNLGHDVIIIDRRSNRNKIKQYIIDIMLFLRVNRYYKLVKDNKLLASFVKQKFNRSSSLYNSKDLKKYIKKHQIDAVVIGSDQVWRADFCLDYDFDFWGGFIDDKIKPIVFSYSASISSDIWAYDQITTEKLKQFVSNFSGVSVREESAVALCKNNLGIIPKWLIDPTLLFDSMFYDKIASSRLVQKEYIFVYWLGDKSVLNQILQKYKLQYEIIIISLREHTLQKKVEDWLSYIKYSEFVITDSFHGIVFSILYHKKFKLYKNDSGGNTRLESLFKKLDIKVDLTDFDILLDYQKIDKRLDVLRKDSYGYIVECLKS